MCGGVGNVEYPLIPNVADMNGDRRKDGVTGAPPNRKIRMGGEPVEKD